MIVEMDSQETNGNLRPDVDQEELKELERMVEEMRKRDFSEPLQHTEEELTCDDNYLKCPFYTLFFHTTHLTIAFLKTFLDNLCLLRKTFSTLLQQEGDKVAEEGEQCFQCNKREEQSIINSHSSEASECQ